MGVPAEVRRADEAADVALAELEKARKETAADATALSDFSEDGQQIPAVEVPAEEVQVEPVKEVETAGVAGEPIPVVQPAVEPEEVGFKQKFLTLKGKYNAEVPRLQAQITALQSRILTEPPREVPAASESEVPKGPGYARYLKKEEVDDFGNEVLDMQARMAKGVAEEVIEGRVKPYLEEIERLKSLVAHNSVAGFWENVESQIPDARRINAEDALWHEFLNSVEPNSGLMFREIGDRAFESKDAAMMINVFNKYIAATGEASGESEGEVIPQLKKAPPPVKPGKVASKPAVTKSAAKPKIRESEIKQFYDDVARGKYRGREETMKARDLVIESALEDGRIIPG